MMGSISITLFVAKGTPRRNEKCDALPVGLVVAVKRSLIPEPDSDIAWERLSV